MIYREAGQYKVSYQADQAIFPIAQDRVVMLALLAVAFFVVPFVATEYVYRAVLIPTVILALAAIGLNVLMGYCGQVSLGSGAFMRTHDDALKRRICETDTRPEILVVNREVRRPCWGETLATRVKRLRRISRVVWHGLEVIPQTVVHHQVGSDLIAILRIQTNLRRSRAVCWRLGRNCYL